MLKTRNRTWVLEFIGLLCHFELFFQIRNTECSLRRLMALPSDALCRLLFLHIIATILLLYIIIIIIYIILLLLHTS